MDMLMDHVTVNQCLVCANCGTILHEPTAMECADTARTEGWIISGGEVICWDCQDSSNDLEDD
jgi:hypothetical protein